MVIIEKASLIPFFKKIVRASEVGQRARILAVKSEDNFEFEPWDTHTWWRELTSMVCPMTFTLFP